MHCNTVGEDLLTQHICVTHMILSNPPGRRGLVFLGKVDCCFVLPISMILYQGSPSVYSDPHIHSLTKAFGGMGKRNKYIEWHIQDCSHKLHPHQSISPHLASLELQLRESCKYPADWVAMKLNVP